MTERFDVRLRVKDPAERELIDALEGAAVYGGKNELMRECLRRGFLLLKQTMEHIPGDDEVRALDALAQAFVSGDYSYRLVKVFLAARNRVAGDQEARGVQGGPSPAVVQEQTPEPVQTPVALPAVPVGQESSPVVAADGGERRVDWRRMRGIAGTGGES